MSGWYYYNELITDVSQMPAETFSFVYKITRLRDGKFYIGKKLCYFTKTSTKTVTLKNGSKKKKKVKTLIPSDWMTYWSSSEELQKSVKEEGEHGFKREILYFCANKSTASYYEAREQMDLRVLELGDKTYNGIINLRVNWRHLKPLLYKGKENGI